MKKITLILIFLLWISGLVILIIAMTGLIPDNPFAGYQFLVGLGFIVLTGLLRNVYHLIVKRTQKAGITTD